MKNISTLWKNIIIWVSSYVSSIAFILVGGYLWKNTTDDSDKKTIKKAFIVHLIFIGIYAVIAFFDQFLFNICGVNYGTGFYNFWSIFKAIIAIAKIVTYAVFVIMEFCKNSKNSKEPDKETKTQKSKDEEEVEIITEEVK